MNEQEILYDFYRARAKNGQHVQLVTDLLEDIPREVAVQYGFLPQWTAFSTAGGNEVACYKADKGYLETPEIVQTDVVRDLTFGFYREIVRAYAEFCPEEEQRKAGSTLAFAFKETGNAARMDYTGETATLTDLVERLRTEPYATALTTIGMDEMPDKIEAANQAFHEIYNQRSTDVRQRVQSASMKTLRPLTDEAFNTLAKAINALYAVNEMVTQDEETRTALGKVINDVNDTLMNFRRILGMGGSGKDEEETPTPEPEEPAVHEITAFYPKEGANPDKLLEFPRNKTAVLEGSGLKLVDSPEGKKAQLVLINYVDQRMPHEDSALLLNTDEKIEFTMMYDAAEGQYNFQIETYPDGTEEPVIIKYPETITLV